jgi:hypothetical protein
MPCEEGLGVAEHVALVVDERQVLPVGVDGRSQNRPGRPDQAGDLFGVVPRVVGEDPSGRGVGIHGQHVGVELRQQVRHHEGGGPEPVVDDHLRPALLDQLDVHGRLERDRVLLERPRREPDVADLPR